MSGRKAAKDIRPGNMALSVGNPKLDIPNGWIWADLGEIATMATGHTPSRNYPEYWGGDIPWISVKDARPFHSKTIFSTNENTNDLGISKSAAVVLPKGTVCLSRTGSIGYSIILGKEMATSQGFINWICSFGLLPRYLQLLFVAENTFLHTISEGVAHTTIYFPEAKAFHIALPPLAEQQRIVAKIEELFSELEKGIEILKTAQQQLKVYRQAVLKYAFEGKLTNPDVKEGELPEGWEYKKISDIAKINPTLPNKEVIDRNLIVQFLPMKLVEEIVNKIHLTETRKYADVLKGSYTPFIDNDIIFAKVTPCMENGKIAIVNNLMNGIGFGSSEFHVLRCNDKILNSYLHRFIVQDKFRNEAQKAMTGAVGLRRVPKQFIETYSIPVPNTLEEQSKIIQEIESRLSVCDKIEESIIQGLQQAEALRQSILKRAFEGKLVPQDPNDEPASVLLERIKAERAAAQPEKKTKTKKVKA